MSTSTRSGSAKSRLCTFLHRGSDQESFSSQVVEFDKTKFYVLGINRTVIVIYIILQLITLYVTYRSTVGRLEPQYLTLCCTYTVQAKSLVHVHILCTLHGRVEEDFFPKFSFIKCILREFLRFFTQSSIFTKKINDNSTHFLLFLIEKSKKLTIISKNLPAESMLF